MFSIGPRSLACKAHVHKSKSTWTHTCTEVQFTTSSHLRNEETISLFVSISIPGKCWLGKYVCLCESIDAHKQVVFLFTVQLCISVFDSAKG